MIITAVRDGDGRLIGFGKVTRDLTERKNSEERMREPAVCSRCRMKSADGWEESFTIP